MGGKGQEKLLAVPVRVVGLEVTAAYLAAGGTPVETEARSGFFAGTSVADFNPDAVASPGSSALIARVPFGFPVDATRAVAVGGDGVVFRDGGCPDCFAQSAAALAATPPSVAVEALAALAWQRIVLGLAGPLGALRLSGEPGVVRRCEAHP